MRRLYLHIYIAFIGILILFGVLVSVAWLLTPPNQDRERLLRGMASIFGDLLPAPQRPAAELDAALERLAGQIGVDLSIHAPDGTLLASAGGPLPPPRPEQMQGTRTRAHGPTIALQLPDGRWLSAQRLHRHRFRWLGALALLAIAVAVGAYPLARRITRRLERLQVSVDQLGSGDLAARVDVEGHDEVANLARSFNHAAERIERLVDSQRSMLASASHELRSPLTRIRMAIELLAAENRPELHERIAKDIAELDELIDELLLASRLEAMSELEGSESVDVLGLAAEEGARVDASVSGSPAPIVGNSRLLRRMVRNLLENALRHGDGASIQATVEALGRSGAKLTVCDRGPGVPEEERERIFEPFYRPAGTCEGIDRGVGLGLSLVRQIARRHDGEAHCLPREGGGTCFEIRLRCDSGTRQ